MARRGRSQPAQPIITRAVAAAAAPLASGTATFTDADTTQANLVCTAASGGTGPVTYLWKRAATAIGTYSSTGLTTLAAADNTISAGSFYYWYCEATDALSNVVTSNIIYGNLWQAPIILGAVGDSILFGFNLSAGQDPPTQTVARLSRLTKQRRVTLGSNSAVSATTTGDWATDSGGILTTAEAAFVSASVTDVEIMLGTNDARTGVAAATYATNLDTIVTHLFAHVGTLLRIWLHYPPWSADTIATSLANAKLLSDYKAQIDSLVNGTTTRQGDRLAQEFFAAHTSEFQGDNLHPNAPGAADLGLLHANALDAGLNSSGGSTSGGLQTGGGGMTGGMQKT